MGKTDTLNIILLVPGGIKPYRASAGGIDMEEYMAYGYPKAPEVAGVVNEIVELLQPASVYLYNQKFSAAGDTTSFKLCVIGDFADKTAAEREIYREIDSEVPFDVILYTSAEWKRLCDHKDSFARKIFLTGTVVYGQA